MEEMRISREKIEEIITGIIDSNCSACPLTRDCFDDGRTCRESIMDWLKGED